MLRLVLRCLLMISCVVFAGAAYGQDFPSAATQLAAKISSAMQPGDAFLNVENRSLLSNPTVVTIRAELASALQAGGWKLSEAPGSGTASIAVELSENFSQYVWTATVTKADTRAVALVQVPRPVAGQGERGNDVVLTRSLLIVSGEPLLDATLLEGKVVDGAHLLALTPQSVELYQFQSGQWRNVQSQPLQTSSLPTRDFRGRIAPSADGFDAFLPGLHCTGTVAAGLSLTCRPSDDSWPLSDERRLLAFYSANRNYFNGVTVGPKGESENIEPFYSAAVLSSGAAYAAIDGHIRVDQPGNPQQIISGKWGSNIAALQSSCRPDLVLVTSSADFTAPDAVTAYRLSSTELTPASDAVPFAGPVMSLKTLADGQQAMAVVASPSGRYEVYLLTARCGS
ncbi:MAG TPA: hypothetical protein VFQ00_10080 [Terriglobales bacterium]|nr:hypothetical protein [Terriglobales bacterium]